MFQAIFLAALFSSLSNASEANTPVQIQMELGLTQCENKLIDRELQNCIQAEPLKKTLLFDLNQNCSLREGKKICTDTSMNEIRLESGSAMALLVTVSDETTEGEETHSLHIMLIPGLNVFQQTRVTIELKPNGEIPSKISLGAASYVSEEDGKVYIPTLKLQ